MPFFEVFDFAASAETRRRAVEAMTAALCEAYDIGPEIVSAYFLDVSGDRYAHCGKLGAEAEERRIFIKLHAFRRSRPLRRAAARMVTVAAARAYAVPEDSIAVYFLEREPDEVAHGGALAGG